jgi:hypothetical protein
MSFKYYIYVSDAKVEMMISQIDPSFQRKRTAEWTLNFKIFGAKKGTEATPGDNRFARLETVVRYLEDYGDLGTVDQPGQFFRGSLLMKWGPLEVPTIFYFGGYTDHTILGLVGSAAHLIGADTSRPSERPVGSLGYALPPLAEALQGDRDAGQVAPPEVGSPVVSAEQGALNAVYYATTVFPGPTQNLEFIAKRLVHGRSYLPEQPGVPATCRRGPFFWGLHSTWRWWTSLKVGNLLSRS